MTVLSKYKAGQAPVNNPRTFYTNEFRRVENTTESIIAILQALQVPIEIGPPDSAGVGFRALRIPN